MQDLETKPLDNEDISLCFNYKVEAEKLEAARNALHQAHALLVDNLRKRHAAPESEGWVLRDYLEGFVRHAPSNGHAHAHVHLDGTEVENG